MSATTPVSATPISFNQAGECTVPWITRLPRGWDATRLKFVVENCNVTVNGSDSNLDYVSLDQVEGWTGRRFLPEDPPTPESTVRRFERGDVLFGKLRPYLAKTWLAENDGVCTGEMLVIRPSKQLRPMFLKYAFLSKPLIDFINASTYGAKMPRAEWSFISNTMFPVPPRTEQDAIVAFLDRKLADIDRFIAKKCRLIELLNEQKATIVDTTVAHGLNHQVEFYSSPSEYWGRIPSHWTFSQIYRITESRRPVMYGIVLPGPNVDDGVFIVKGGNCEPGRLRPELLSRTTYEIDARYERSRLKPNDIVYAIRGSIGAADIVPAELEGANLTQDAARIAPGPGIFPKWLLHTVRSRRFFAKLDAGAVGATIRGINIRDLKRAELPLPPVDEQVAIANFLDERLQELDAAQERSKREIELMNEFRASLVSEAVTGRINVRSRA